MDSSAKSLLFGFDALLDKFSPHVNLADGEAVEMDGPTVRVVVSMLRNMRHLASLNERELGALRLMEVHRTANVAVWQELDRVLDDNVVRPDFGGRS